MTWLKPGGIKNLIIMFKMWLWLLRNEKMNNRAEKVLFIKLLLAFHSYC